MMALRERTLSSDSSASSSCACVTSDASDRSGTHAWPMTARCRDAGARTRPPTPRTIAHGMLGIALVGQELDPARGRTVLATVSARAVPAVPALDGERQDDYEKDQAWVVHGRSGAGQAPGPTTAIDDSPR